jgi:hypothetical protein
VALEDGDRQLRQEVEVRHILRRFDPEAGISRRSVRAVSALVALAMVFAVSAASAAPASPVAPSASADIDVSLAIAPGTPPPVAGRSFSMTLGMGNAGPDAASARLLVVLPENLAAITANALGCPTGTGTLDCGRLDLAPLDTTDAFFGLRAPAPGTYTVVARATDLAVPDPNPANNSVSVNITVRAASPVVTGFARSPARPRAGAEVTVSFAVIEPGTQARVTPSAVRCTASAAGAKVRGRGSVRAGRATCIFSPPTSARGSTLRGKISATAAGKRLTRAFAVQLL